MPPEVPEGEDHQASGSQSAPSPNAPAKGPRKMLAWAWDNRLKAGLIAGACLVSVGGVVALWLLSTATAASQHATLDAAMESLDSGAYQEARQMAEALGDGGLSPEDALGAPSFVLGAAAAYEADDAWTTDKEHLYLLAARYLEEARDLGFPPGRKGEGLFLLGRSLYLSGQMAASRPVLREAIAANPRMRTEIHRFLAGAYLEDANPKYTEALEHNVIYLADPTLSVETRHRGLLQRAEILLQLGKTSQCASTLDKIPPDAHNHAEAILTRGRVLIREARALKNAPQADEEDRLKAVEKYQTAIKTLRIAQGRATLDNQASRKGMYLIGVCFLELGDADAALDQFGRTRRRYIKTPEALAADFQIAELSRRQGRNEEALAAYRRALGAVTDVKQYANPWLALDQLRARTLSAYEHYRDTEKFDICLRLTRLLDPIFSRARTVELTAETCQLWGQSLLARASQLPPSEAEPLRREGCAQLRRAGRIWEQLAKLRVTTRHYPDDLWDSAECYREGQGYESAVEVLREYLKSQSQQRHPRALVNLGEALLALGRIDEALVAFNECIEFHPRHPASFRARLAASLAHHEKGDLDQAETLLEENLNGDFLTPDSNEWRDSLFALGQMMHLAGRHEEAAAQLEEAVARYPDSPQTIEAQYLIADSYRRLAKTVEEKLDEDLIEAARLAHSKKVSEFLLAALDRYRQAREALTERQKATELTSTEKSLLRNCDFAIGSILFDLKQYEEAVKAYGSVTSRYQNAPEVLEAYVQIARAYRLLNQPDDARRALQQARVVLDRMETPAEFELTTIYTADEWPNVLDSGGSRE